MWRNVVFERKKASSHYVKHAECYIRHKSSNSNPLVDCILTG